MKCIGAILISLALLFGCFCAFAEEDVATRNEEEEEPILIDGELLLKIRFDFRDEDDLLQHDVDVYLDGNLGIGSKSLPEYAQKIQSTALSSLLIQRSFTTINLDDVDDVKSVLDNRFVTLQGNIKNRINTCLHSWQNHAAG